MRVLITAGIFPPEIGGPSTYVPRIASALVQRGHTVGVIAPLVRGVACPIQDPPYRLIQFERAGYLRILNYLIENIRVLRVLLENIQDYDLLYANGLDLPVLLVCRMTKTPLVIKIVGDRAWELAFNRGFTTHNMEEFQEVRGLIISMLKSWLRVGPKGSQATIVPSKYLAGIVKKWGVPEDQIHVVYNAVTIHELQGEYSLPKYLDQGFKIVMIGRLIPLKRMDQVIELLPSLEGTRLIIVGDGPWFKMLQEKVENLGLMDRTYFTKQIPQSQVMAILRNEADVLVLNSVHESFPHVMIEASLCGVPVIATRVGGVPEFIFHEETGLLISPDSPGELKSAILRLMHNPLLAKRLAENAQAVAKRFTTDQMISQTENVLRGLIP